MNPLSNLEWVGPFVAYLLFMAILAGGAFARWQAEEGNLDHILYLLRGERPGLRWPNLRWWMASLASAFGAGYWCASQPLSGQTITVVLSGLLAAIICGMLARRT